MSTEPAASVKNQSEALLKLDNARRLLAEVKTVREAKEIRDKAQAIQHFLKQQGYSEEAIADAAELKLRAERRLGELLAADGERRGGKNKATNLPGGSSHPLPDGVSQKQSHHWQKVASVAEPDFERYVASARQIGRITTKGAVRLARQSAVINNCAPGTCTVRDLQRLIDLGRTFGTIYVDPPWRYGNQATRAATNNHYRTLTVDEIAAHPVKELAAANAHLHLWTTNAFLSESKHILESWGFTYKSVFVWVKPRMGIGNYWRVSHEFMLLGIRGDCPFLDRSQRSWLECEPQAHSAKPDAVRMAIEKVSPGPRLELFGRTITEGWTVWGDQIAKRLFDGDVELL
jgi:N6-adenosine-specific RNA methylase IME4